MDRKDYSNLGYSRQTTDTNTSLGDLPSGASARDDTKEQLKMYRAKVKASDGKQFAFGSQTQTVDASGAGANDATNEQLKTARAKAHQRYTAHKNNQTVEEPGNNLQEKEVEGMSNVMNTKLTMKCTNDENENKAECEQLLSKMLPNDRVLLSNLLDSNGIQDLVGKLLNAQDALDIWRACHGGHDPAMGLIFTLAQSKLTTLKEFREFASKANGDGPGKASKDGPGKAKRLLDIIEEYPGYFNETLDKLPFDLLAKIASEISANPHPSREQSWPLWKTIAGHAGLNDQDIRVLDIPTLRASKRESMTMKFIEIVGQRYPEKKVSWLVKGLLAVNRRDIVVNRKLFVHCREHCCKNLFTTNNPNT